MQNPETNLEKVGHRKNYGSEVENGNFMKEKKEIPELKINTIYQAAMNR